MTYALSVLSLQGRPVPAIEVGGGYWNLQHFLPQFVTRPETGLLGVLERWDEAREQLLALARMLEQAPAGATGQIDAAPEEMPFLLLSHPRKIICAGMNYYDHLRDDMGVLDFAKESTDPLFFLKQSGSLVPSGTTIPFPSQTKQLDWEVELVVIFGRKGQRIKAADVDDYIAGYTTGLDLSARDWQFNPRHPRQFDLMTGKAFDGSAPIGPKMVPAHAVDPTELLIRLWVNGAIKQDSHTREMIWSIGELVEYFSLHCAIEPGDLLFTGSPAGVGWASGTFLNQSDVVEAEIGGLGHLRIDFGPSIDSRGA